MQHFIRLYLAHSGQELPLTLSLFPITLGTMSDVHHKRYPGNICFRLSCPQEYNNLYMVDPHNLFAMSTFSCPCSLIICSTIHSGIHKGSVPSSPDYIHLYPLLQSQELGKLYAGGGASPWCWWAGMIWVEGREGEAIWKPESLQSKCGWKTELFTDIEDGFVLVKSWLTEHWDNLEKGMRVGSREMAFCPRGK